MWGVVYRRKVLQPFISENAKLFFAIAEAMDLKKKIVCPNVNVGTFNILLKTSAINRNFTGYKTCKQSLFIVC